MEVALALEMPTIVEHPVVAPQPPAAETPEVVTGPEAVAETPETVTTEEQVPTIHPTVVDPDADRFAGGKVIIRRGDTLWAISRRVYGRGIHYRTIYRANRDQIRRPSLIYPGQVFVIPPRARR